MAPNQRPAVRQRFVDDRGVAAKPIHPWPQVLASGVAAVSRRPLLAAARDEPSRHQTICSRADAFASPHQYSPRRPVLKVPRLRARCTWEGMDGRTLLIVSIIWP